MSCLVAVSVASTFGSIAIVFALDAPSQSCRVVWYTYTVNDTVSAVQYAVDNYYSMNDISPDSYGYTYR